MTLVSIQLMSPASGDDNEDPTEILEAKVSIQLMSPASGDFITQYLMCGTAMFPFN